MMASSTKDEIEQSFLEELTASDRSSFLVAMMTQMGPMI